MSRAAPVIRGVASAVGTIIPANLAPPTAIVTVCLERYGVPLTSFASGVSAFLMLPNPILAPVAAVIGELTIAEALRRKLWNNPVASVLYSGLAGAALVPFVALSVSTPVWKILGPLAIFAAFVRPPLAPLLYEKRKKYDPWRSIVLSVLMLYSLAPLVGFKASVAAFLIAKGVDGAGGLGQFFPESINPVVSLEGFRIRKVEEGISPFGTAMEFLAGTVFGYIATGDLQGAVVMGAVTTTADVLSNVTGVEDFHKGDDLLMMLAAAWVLQHYGMGGLVHADHVLARL
ncbi:MAG: hypothetical protein GXO28_05020 [Methanopyri archaeon]|nr:hypothetical protein [Methanopyri archaeon]